MIHRVTPWLLTAVVLLAAVPCELVESRTETPSLPSGSTEILVNELGSPEPVRTASLVDCVCLCRSGHSTPTVARNLLTPFGGPARRPMPDQLIPKGEPLGSIFHPPQVA